MKKKVLALIVAAGMLMAIFGGCSGGSGSGDQNDDVGSNYPNKPIQIIVPVPAGGDTDYNARVLAEYVSKYIGQPVVVTNVEGGGTVTGMQQILDGNPDGYSLVVNGTDVFVPNMLGNTEVTLDSFKTAGISLIDNTTVLAVHKDSGFTQLPELVEASKANPQGLEYGMKIGATNNICGIAMGTQWGAEFKNVDVGNNAAKMTALLAKQTDVININYSLAKDYFTTGEFVPLVLLGSEKNQALPELPLAEDFGMENLDYSKFFWLGMHPETPDEIVKIFSDALKKACEDPEYIEKMEANYLTVKFMEPQEAHQFALNFYEETMLPFKEDFVNQ
jgi:tripartite-type tricarboxylate transporter receptor subunit TctC